MQPRNHLLASLCAGLCKRNGTKFRELSSNFPKLGDWLCMSWPFCLAALGREFLNRGTFLLLKPRLKPVIILHPLPDLQARPGDILRCAGGPPHGGQADHVRPDFRPKVPALPRRPRPLQGNDPGDVQLRRREAVLPKGKQFIGRRDD